MYRRNVVLLFGLLSASFALAACGGRTAPGLADGGAVVDLQGIDGPNIRLDGPMSPDAWIPDAVPPPPLDQGVADLFPQPDLGPGDNSTCQKALQVPLVDGKAVVKGTTQGAPNEYGNSINCGNYAYIYRGNQRYYRFTLQAGVSYRFSLVSNVPGRRMYVFRSCGASKINADCGSKGASGAATVGSEGDLVFAPKVGGDYIVAVDSLMPGASGAFTLSVAPFSTPKNASCQGAQRLTLQNGKVSVKGSTALAKNEFGTQINCGSSSWTYPAPQLYYRLQMNANTTYRLRLMAQFFGGRFYVFGATCTPSQINADCGSKGKMGLVSSTTSPGNTISETFTPTVSGDYTIAVDAGFPTELGDFELIIDTQVAPTNTTCAKARALTLTNGKASVQGSTFGAQNEFGSQIVCDQFGVSMAGPQVYYKVKMTAGKNYKLTLKPNYPARWYLFGQVCTANQINADCAASGINGDLVSANSSSTRLYTPSVTGTYTVAVDSRRSDAFGDFQLDVEELAPPSNETCAKATLLTLQNGKVKVTGSTHGSTNEFGSQIRCAQGFGLTGGQVYYKLALKATELYRIRLQAFYPARWYLFGDTCQPALIDQQCKTSGIDGDLVSTGQTALETFQPKTSGIYTIAIDARNDSWSGDFELEVEASTPPSNDSCNQAKLITVKPQGQTTTITGDTTNAVNEFGNQITCNQWGGIMDGPQLYYKLQLQASRRYDFTLQASYTGRRLLLVRDLCQASSINQDCGPNSPNGELGTPGFGQPAGFSFKPPQDGTYMLIVDGTYGGGPFTVEIR